MKERLRQNYEEKIRMKRKRVQWRERRKDYERKNTIDLTIKIRRKMSYGKNNATTERGAWLCAYLYERI